MNKAEIIQTIEDYKETHQGTKYIRVCQPNNFITPVEVDSLTLTNKEKNEWEAKAASGETVGFKGDYIVEFKEW